MLPRKDFNTTASQGRVEISEAIESSERLEGVEGVEGVEGIGCIECIECVDACYDKGTVPFLAIIVHE